MAITIASETTGTATGGVGDVVTVTKPSTVANDDYLVVVMGVGDDDPDIAPPTGWTTGDRAEGTSGTDVQMGIFYKLVTDAASEPANYTFTAGNGDAIGWWIGSLRGVDLTTPEDETMSGNAVYRLNDTSPLADSITTATDGAFILAGWTSQVDFGPNTTNAEWSSRADDLNLGATNGLFNLASTIKVSAGATVGVDLVGVDSGAETVAGQWAFRPAGAAAATTTPPRRMLMGVGT